MKSLALRDSVMQFGHWMHRHRGLIQAVQWSVVGVYAFLLIVPALLPLPSYQDHILTHLTVFAEFVFWGIWWPFVLVSMVLMGRVWCGVFCPEGALTEAASRRGLGLPIPGWMRWQGWPFVAFLGTTLYGQMASVYQYPLGALVVLGGSTAAAIVIGLIYGKGKRVWCRHLCPVSGVFGLLSKLAPVHFKTDPEAWQAFNEASRKGEVVRMHAPDCAPLIPLKQLDSGSECHMCARCDGYKSAIQLSPRRPGSEVVSPPREATLSEFLVLVYGLLGVAIGAFQWTVSPWFVQAKQMVATWLVEHDALWVLTTSAPAWILTNYPNQNDVFNLLDGAMLVTYILGTGLVLGSAIALMLALSNRLLGQWSWSRLWHLSYVLIPLGGVGVFLGLSATTVTLLRGDGFRVLWANDVRLVLLALATLWSIQLAWKVLGHYGQGGRRLLSLAAILVVMVMINGAWWLMFWGW